MLSTQIISLTLKLYYELLSCESEPPDFYDEEGYEEFHEAMLNAESDELSFDLLLNETGWSYLIRIVVFIYMEMWYTWGSEEGDELLNEARAFLNTHDIFYPY